MARTLIDALREVPDRRGRKGRQNALPAILSLSIAAVLSGLEFNLKVVERYQQVVIGFDDVDARDDPNVWQRRMVGITIGDRHDKRGLHDRFGFGQERLSSSWR
jgi:hypothetical protein